VTEEWTCAGCTVTNSSQWAFCTSCGNRRNDEVAEPNSSFPTQTNRVLTGRRPIAPPPPPRHHSSGPTPIGGASPTPHRTGSLWVLWTALGAVGVLVILGVVGLVLVPSSTNATRPPSTVATKAKSGSSPGGSSETGAGPSTSSAPNTSAGTGTLDAPPDSTSPSGRWVKYSDASTGFTIWYPAGWTIDQTTDGTFFRDPGVNAYLLAAHVSPAGPSAIGAWQQQESDPSFESAHPNYERVSMSGDSQQASWEYVYEDNGTEMHGIDWGAVVDSAKYGFALNWVTDGADWTGLQPTFQSMERSFVPPVG